METLISRLDPTPWVEHDEIRIEDDEDVARRRG